jgi:hypothetical protein
MVWQQILTPLAAGSYRSSPLADQRSLMAYSFPGSITKSGQPIPGGVDFTDLDRQFAGEVYPLAVLPPKPPVEPPPHPPGNYDLDLRMNFVDKRVSIRLPSGWTVAKLTAGETFMDPTVANDLANELLGCIPAQTTALGNSPLGVLISKAIDLITALKAQDFKAVATVVRDILNILLGDTGTIGFAAQSATAGFDFAKFVSILLKILPILLGA